MATSTLTLYELGERDFPHFTKEKNFIIENIENFLQSYQRRTIQLIQYQRLMPKIEIKVDMTQLYVNPRENNLQYAKIVNSDSDKPFYYWITNIEWKSTSTCKLTLEMDVLNTFKIGEDYQFSEKTLIHRQHENRFIGDIETYLDYDMTSPEIDFYEDKEIALKSNFVQWTLNTRHTLSGYNAIIKVYDIHTQELINVYDNDYDYIERKYLGGYDVISLPYGGSILLNFSRFIYTIALKPDPDYPGQYDAQQVQITNLFNNIKGTLVEKNKIKRKIDEYSEGINPILYANGNGEQIIQDGLDQDFYLLYKGSGTTETQEALDCFLYSDNGLSLNAQPSPVSINPINFEDGIYYYFNLLDNPGGEFTLVSTTYTLSEENKNYWYAFHREGEQLRVFRGSKKANKWNFESEQVGIFTIDELIFIFTKGNFLRKGTSIGEPSVNIQIEYPSQNNFPINAGISSATISSINSVAKTDIDLLKIIDLPYCPSDFQNGFISSEWESRSQDPTIHLKNLDNKFINVIRTNITPFNELYAVHEGSIDVGEARNDKYESKLYHSDYYQPRAVYDSFAFTFMLETIDTEQFDYTNIDNFIINFVQTTTINSKFLFEFPQYLCGKLQTRDFNNYLVIARNNEMPIYNSAYLNYIKTGYNYDLKTKDRNNTRNWVGIGLGALGSIASFVGGGAFGVVGGISLATSTLAQLNNAISSTAQSEDNMKQKLEQLQMTSSNVAGSDDVDLMKYYSKNRLKLITYKISDRMKKALSDLFFYCGYKRDIQSIPNFNSRYRFNYVQCEIFFQRVKGMTKEEIEMLSNAYSQGVTLIHERPEGYDVAQYYENWETNLL